ncbi:MAG: PucR family transcriptional regulator [Acidimicrobiales bacterium]
MVDAAHAAGGWQGMRAVADLLDQEADKLTASITTLLQGRLDPYGSLSLDEIAPGVATSFRFGVDALRDRRPPSEEETEELATVAETRARQGLPFESVLAAYRLGTHVTWSRCRVHAERIGVDPASLLEAAELVWQWSEQVTAKAAATHRHTELALVRHDQQHRTNFLRGAVLGLLDAAKLRDQAPLYGLDPQVDYLAFRAAPRSKAASYEAERALLVAADIEGQGALVGLIDSDVVGLAPAGLRSEDLAELGIAVGLGPLGPLSSAAASFSVASKILRSALSFGLQGAFELRSLGLLVAVASEAELGDELVGRYLEPLASLREAGRPVETSLKQFLASGLRVEAAASSLFVHSNTLRYRLRSFERVTGASLDRIEDVVGIWWALKWRQIRPDGSAAAPERVVDPGSLP